MSTRVILTAAPESEPAALADVRRSGVQGVPPRSGGQGRSGVPAPPSDRSDPSNPSDSSAHSPPHSQRLAPGILLLDLPAGFAALAAGFRDHPPLFVRHIQPVDREVPLAGEGEDLDRLEAAALELAPRLDPARSFSVQTRLTAPAPPSPSERPYGRFEVNERLAGALQAATGAPLDVREPQQVLSVLLTPSVGYLGLSRVEENLSAWAGGAIRFAREPEQVSRSEFKLLEALQVFGLTLPAAGAALDLGAAPGGWTRLLRQAGLTVTAVDPGDLDPRVAADPGVRHARVTAQQFRCREGECSAVVNDMRMDARDSARLMLDYAPCLARDGLAIMTLKLPERAPEAVAHQAIGLLLRRYELLGARQLYHNRSEITVALRRRASPVSELRTTEAQRTPRTAT